MDQWDLVVLDWWLPGLDGLQLLQRFRQQNTATPVLFLTARDAVTERVTGLDQGADDYLTKPFSFDELLARVRARLRAAGQPESTVIEIGRLRLDLVGRTATVAGKQVELTTREFLLAETLARHAGQVLSRE